VDKLERALMKRNSFCISDLPKMRRGTNIVVYKPNLIIYLRTGLYPDVACMAIINKICRKELWE